MIDRPGRKHSDLRRDDRALPRHPIIDLPVFIELTTRRRAGRAGRYRLLARPHSAEIGLDGEIDQLTHRGAGFECGEPVIDLGQFEPARDQVIELEPTLPPQ